MLRIDPFEHRDLKSRDTFIPLDDAPHSGLLILGSRLASRLRRSVLDIRVVALS
jgi:hypothetical protein